MNAQELVSIAKQQGYELISAGQNIKYRGIGEPPHKLIEHLRKHKQEVLIWLTAKERLSLLAKEYKWDVDDLLDWFKDPMDMHDLARWTIPQVRQSVEFYIDHHERFRGVGK
jgi:hypothetical protein